MDSHCYLIKLHVASKYPTQSVLRPNITKEMQHEFPSCPVETFLSPSAENIRYGHDILVESDQWKAFSCTNPSSSMEREEKVFKPLEVMISILLGLHLPVLQLVNFGVPVFGAQSALISCSRASLWAVQHPKLMHVWDWKAWHSTNSWDPIQSLLLQSPRIARASKAYALLIVMGCNWCRNLNRQQLLSAASYIMNDNPCCMWMYGVCVSLNEHALHQCPPVP